MVNLIIIIYNSYCYIILHLVLTGHSSLYLLHFYVSCTDIEIELEPSDEEFTDCVGKLKLHINETKYNPALFIAYSSESLKTGQWISNFSVSSPLILCSHNLHLPPIYWYLKYLNCCRGTVMYGCTTGYLAPAIFSFILLFIGFFHLLFLPPRSQQLTSSANIVIHIWQCIGNTNS